MSDQQSKELQDEIAKFNEVMKTEGRKVTAKYGPCESCSYKCGVFTLNVAGPARSLFHEFIGEPTRDRVRESLRQMKGDVS